MSVIRSIMYNNIINTFIILDLGAAPVPEAVKHTWLDLHLPKSIKVTRAISYKVLRWGPAVAPLSFVNFVDELDE